MMISIFLFVFLILGCQAAPEICEGTQCGAWRAFGLTYDWYCGVTDENLYQTLPPGLAKDARQCEAFSIDSAESNWFTFHSNGSCDLLRFCENLLEEEGAITGPDPGTGESCFPSPPQEVLLVIGGYGVLGFTSTVDVITSNMEVVSDAVPVTPFPPDGYWTASLLGDLVVVCGGETNPDQCIDLNITSKTWSDPSFLRVGRYDAESIVHNNTMYVLGGRNPALIYHSNVERWDNDLNSWVDVPEWALPSGLAKSCAVEHEDYIYHIAGELSGPSATRTLWRLSTATDEYETMKPMDEFRQGHACVATTLQGEEGILVTGGLFGIITLYSTEFYSFASQKWQKLVDMNFARRDHGIGVLNGQPLVFGGYGGDGSESHLDSIEVYDEVQQKWLVVENAKLTLPRDQFAYAKAVMSI